MTQQMKTTDYIWDNTVFEHVVRDIQFFSEIHLVSEEDKELIKDDLLLLTDELEELAGKVSMKPVTMYVSISQISSSMPPIAMWQPATAISV